MNLVIETKRLKEILSKLKDKYPELTDSDIKITNNNEKNILSMVSYKLRKSQQEMSDIIEKL